jgi:hypothetical protein
VKPVRTLRTALAAIVFLALAGRGETATAPRIEPAALHLLHSAADYLKAQKSFSFNADIRYDDVQRSGLKYQLHAAATYEVARPGNLFVSYTGDRRSADFYSDGKTFVFYDRIANVYGSAPATNDNNTTLNNIFAKFDFTVPLDDLVSNDPEKSLAGKLQSGYDLGSSSVGGVATHHLLFTQADINWQIWIDDGATPLIREISITYKNLPGQPEYTATLRDWKFAPIDASAFSFTPPKDAIHVDFVAVSTSGVQ